MIINIDRGIEKPMRGHGVSHMIRKALLKMRSGESFVVDTSHQRKLVLMVAKRAKVRVSTAKDEVVPGKYRIWRD